MNTIPIYNQDFSPANDIAQSGNIVGEALINSEYKGFSGIIETPVGGKNVFEESLGKAEDTLSSIALQKTGELEYTLMIDGKPVGDKINIPKDQFLKDAKFPSKEGEYKLELVFSTSEGEKTVYVDLSDLHDVLDSYTKKETDDALALKQDKGDYALKSDLPKNVSQLTNDSNYATSGNVKTELDKKQDKLTAGTNITISGNTISAKSTGFTTRYFDSALNASNNTKNVSFRLDGKPAYKGAVPDSVFATDSLSISQGYDESSGIAFDGDKIVMWSPCDGGALVYYDEDDTGSTPVFKIQNNGTFLSPTTARITPFQSTNGRWTLQYEYGQIIGNFVMVTMAWSISANENFSKGQRLQIGATTDSKYNSAHLSMFSFGSSTSAWNSPCPFTAFVNNDILYVKNTHNDNRTLGVEAWYYMSGIYPLQSIPW